LGLVLGATSCGRQEPSFAPGNITVVSTPPGAAILFDGRDTGQVTPYTFVGLEADLYNISVVLPDFVATPNSVPVDLSPLDEITLDFALSQTGLEITSSPAGAKIFLDGIDSGRLTPATIAGLAAGLVDVSLALDTYVVTPALLPVTVLADSILSVPAASFRLQPQRTIMLEGFANIDCGPCPQLADNLVAMSENPAFGPDRVLYIEFSLDFPNAFDPLYLDNAAENFDRFRTDYFILGAPALFVDGVKLDDALDAAAMETRILVDLQTDPGFRIDVSADFSNSSVPVTVTLDPAADVDLTGHSLYIALYEKTIDFATRGLEAGSNGQTIFHHVFRDRVDTPPALGLLTSGIPAVFNVSLARADWAPDNLVVVAFAQRNADFAIIQAGSYGETATAGGSPR
jgi:hypothetical protein